MNQEQTTIIFSQPPQPKPATTLLQVPANVVYYRNGRPNHYKTIKRQLKREVIKAINNWQAYTER